MENNVNQAILKLVDLVDAFIEEHKLPYVIIYDEDEPGIRRADGGSWLAWIYDIEVKSYWGMELMCLNASDPDFFPMLEFWLAFNHEMRKWPQDDRSN